MARWRLQDARRNLPEMLEKASNEGPQTIMVAPGRTYTVSVSRRRSKAKKTKKPDWLEVLLFCPKGPDLKIERDPNDTVGKGDRHIID